MPDNIQETKIKPFRLFRYFTITSLIVLFTGIVMLTVLNTHWARKMQLAKSEEYAQLLAKNLNHQIFLQFVIPVTLKYGKISLRNPEQYELMDKVVRSTFHGFEVDKVTIYDRYKNIVSYSYNDELLGQENVGGKAYQDAVNGNTSYEIIQRGSLLQNLLGFPKEIKLVSYAPLRLEKGEPGKQGQTIGVVELVEDLSEDYKTIFRFQIFVIVTSTLVLGLLFVILLLVVKRGEETIHRRALERLELEEQLNRAERLSALGEMAAAIAHEIRNPLGIINSSAALLKKKIAAIDPNSTIPDVIVEEGNRLNQIISDFINYAKPRQLNLIPTQIERVLDKNIDFLKPQLDESSIRIRSHWDAGLPEIVADPDMLYQAFLNILINAMQSMPHGGMVDIQAKRESDAVRVNFEDEGDGIPDDVFDKIWNPFFTTKDKGSGLGLGIVKNIIEAHGGSITIRNRSRKGACVSVFLPAKGKE